VTHVRTVHEKVQKFCCSRCGLKFGTNSSLKRHFRSKHESELGTRDSELSETVSPNLENSSESEVIEPELDSSLNKTIKDRDRAISRNSELSILDNSSEIIKPELDSDLKRPFRSKNETEFGTRDSEFSETLSPNLEMNIKHELDSDLESDFMISDQIDIKCELPEDD
jgi:hypothetical protein